ncbi:unnamed protein product [Heligmosomoides polygyrus]|uniref:CCHC-type domain-containing protein n=1 Tax=Heligmosomoides polygyrus TaxID=6339 RepID=A0A183G4S2_HELPZ|nr:unnamed protein product [Heligmosomoides polygyrus]
MRELRQTLVACQEQVDAMAKMANKDLNLVANVGHADKTCPRDAMVDSSRDAVAPSNAGGSVRAAMRAMPRRHMIRWPYDLIRLCHFCDQPGYSDSCRNVLSINVRVDIIQRKNSAPNASSHI